MGGKSTTSTQRVEIPPEVMARYNAVNARAEDVAKQPFQQYGGQFVAGLTPTQQRGVQATSSASQLAQPYFGAATGLTMAGAQDVGALTPGQIAYYQNPYTQSVVDPTLAALRQQQGQELSQQQASAIRSGAFGGDRSGLERANLMRQQALGTAQAIAPLYQQGYQQAVQTAAGQQGVVASDLARRMQAGQALAGLGTGAQQAALQGAQAQIGAGTLEQQTQQADLTARYQQFLQERGFPYQQAQFLANIAMGTGALSGSTTTTTQPAGFFSDERLKDNIEPIGQTYDGQPIYRYDYGDGRTQIGLMAQDVLESGRPGVGLHPSGYLTVDYRDATNDAAAMASLGGAVTEPGDYARGGYVAGGLVGSEDLRDILRSQAQSFGPFSSEGLYGGKGAGAAPPGATGIIPPASLPVPKMLTAGSLPQQQSSGMSQAMSIGKGISDLYSAGKSLKSDFMPSDLEKAAKLKREEDLKPYLEKVRKPSAHGGLIPHYADGGAANDDEAMPYGQSAISGNEDILSGVVKSGSQNIQSLPKPGAPPAAGGGDGGIGKVAGLMGSAKSALSGVKEIGAGMSELGSLMGLGEAAAAGAGAAGAAGTAAAGAGAAGTAAGLGSALGSIGSGVASALPFLAMFSDERLKHNIEPVGETFDGQNIYRYDMGDGRTRIGLMAQEVLQRRPDAVGERDGYLTLDYNRATEDAVSPFNYGGVVPRQGYQDGGPPKEEPPVPPADIPEDFDTRLDKTLGALSRIESGGRYDIVGPASRKGDKPYGKYQVMGANIPSWTEEALGRRLTPEEFLADKEAQDATARHRAGLYLKQYDDPRQVASLWLSGRPIEKAGASKDVLGTDVPKYLSMFDRYYGGAEARSPGLVTDADKPSAGAKEAQYRSEEPNFLSSLGEKATSERYLVPALSFVGSMLASRSPFLGQAIGEGLVGGVAGYQSMQKQQMEMAKNLIDVVGNRFERQIVDGNVIYRNKLTGAEVPANQMQATIYNMFKKAGLSPEQYGVGAPGITPPAGAEKPAGTAGAPAVPGAPGAPGQAQPEKAAGEKAGEPPADQKPPAKPLTEMNATQLRNYVLQNPAQFGLEGDDDPRVIRAKITELKQRASDYRTKLNDIPAAQEADRQAQVEQARLTELLNAAIKHQSDVNAKLNEQTAKQAGEFEGEIFKRQELFKRAENNWKRLGDIYADFTTGRSTDFKARLTSWAEGLNIPLPNLEKKLADASNFDAAMKITMQEVYDAMARENLVRAPAATQAGLSQTVPGATLTPGAVYEIIGKNLGELQYVQQRDKAYLDQARGGSPARFLSEYDSSNPYNLKKLVAQGLSQIPISQGVPRQTIDSLYKTYGPYGYTPMGAESQAPAERAAPSLPEPLRNIEGLSYSPSRNQYRDSQGNIYDATGKRVQ